MRASHETHQSRSSEAGILISARRNTRPWPDRYFHHFVECSDDIPALVVLDHETRGDIFLLLVQAKPEELATHSDVMKRLCVRFAISLRGGEAGVDHPGVHMDDAEEFIEISGRL